jgi:polyhydroxybutyrate depolymerase
MHMLERANVALFAAFLAACSDERSPDPDGGVVIREDASRADAPAPRQDSGVLPTTIGTDDRPAEFVIPSAHDGVTPLPVIFLLHGYSANGPGQDLYFGFSRATVREGFYAVIPNGTTDASGNRFWNATPACCNFGGSDVDDVAYLTALLDEVESLVPVAQNEVYFIGHSNGGFMSYRMACELSDRVAAIMSLAGADFLGETDCVPDQPVSVLQIHGDLDSTIMYAGTVGYPSALSAVRRWAARGGCEIEATPGAPLDIDTGIEGNETEVESYETGCEAAEAALWTIRGGAHVPMVTTSTDFMPYVLDWLREHAR